MKLTERQLKNFWEKVDKSPGQGPNGCCWTWGASTVKDGYGQFKLSGKMTKAHRISWSLKNGSIPEGALILHSCHNPACVNPDHLRPGSNQDNTDDMVRAGRQNSAKGERNGSSKLIEQQVVEIRERNAAGENTILLGRTFGVDNSVISDITTGKTWKHVGGPIRLPRKRLNRKGGI